MHVFVRTLLLATLMTSTLGGCASSDTPISAESPRVETVEGASTLVYPAARRSDQVDVLHGVRVADPYRWLEDADSEETSNWVQSQNGLTYGWLQKIPARAALTERLTELWNTSRVEVPKVAGGKLFFRQSDGLQNQPIVYVLDRAALNQEEPRALIDPNTLSADGTIALTDFEPSPDGRYLAYGLSSGGSDWEEWRVRDVASGRDLEERLSWVKFNQAAWSRDGSGFYYSRYDAPTPGAELEQANYFQKLFYHRVGTAQSEDRLIHERRDAKELAFGADVTADGRYLVITNWRGTELDNGMSILDLSQRAAKVVPLLDRFDAFYQFLGSDGTKLWFSTNHSAPRGRVIEIDLAAITPSDPRSWRTLIPETSDALKEVHAVGSGFVAVYLRDAHSRVVQLDAQGKEVREIPLPGLVSAEGFDGERGASETFYSLETFTRPTTVYRLDLASGESAAFRAPNLGFDPDAYETSQIFVPSKDGTKVPVFLTAKKGWRPSGEMPTLLYGYGGFNISLTPDFKARNLVWMERGGLLAIANLRGGGEYGEEWHQAGMKLKKQNVFDDFQAVAAHLAKSGITRSNRIVIDGRSNGGLLTGACLTQRPELFGAAIVGVGVLDMLRFHKFTIGWGWVSDYGSPENPEEFKALYAYSPYHNLKSGTHYPPTLITTADHDDRVVPAHSFKFAAALQHAQGGSAPTLIRIETRAGHGAGKPTRKQIETAADELAFAIQALQLEGAGE